MEATVFYLFLLQNIYQFKVKDSEIKLYPFCLRNVSKYFTVNNMKKTGLNRYVYNLNSHPSITRPAFIDLNPNEYKQRLYCNPFIVNIDKNNGSSNNSDEPSNRTCTPNKTEDINLNAFNMTIRINE